MRNCAECGIYACRKGNAENFPDDCPVMLVPEFDELLQDANLKYSKPEISEFTKNSALTESEGYCKWTRIEEIMEFSKKMGYKKLGIAFCSGLRKEAMAISKIFQKNRFEVYGVMCKIGSVPKEKLGIKDNEKVNPGAFEAMCNPIIQAQLLNYLGTDLNIAVGLCVGHDSIFFKYSTAPVTVLVAKDRVLIHNPCAAIYSPHFYDKKLLDHKR